MTTVRDHLVDQISADFSQACTELARARLRQHVKDSRENRAAVAECSARIDVVLDLFLETRRAVPSAGTDPDDRTPPRVMATAP